VSFESLSKATIIKHLKHPVMFLLAQTKADYSFLSEKQGIHNPDELKAASTAHSLILGFLHLSVCLVN